jgi:hypothetical protein
MLLNHLQIATFKCCGALHLATDPEWLDVDVRRALDENLEQTEGGPRWKPPSAMQNRILER